MKVWLTYLYWNFASEIIFNKIAPRVMAVLNPLKLIIDNYPEDEVEYLEAVNNPEDESAGTRKVQFSKELYIEKSDFMETPPRKYFRLAPGNEVRLRYGYYVKCVGFTKDDSGDILEVHCTYDPETRGGYSPDGRKVKGTIHWVSASNYLDAEIRIYDRLFNRPDPDNVTGDETFLDHLNSDSLQTIKHCKVKSSLMNTKPGDHFQFERLGYFCTDLESNSDDLVFNQTVSLRDTWSKNKN